MRITNVKATTVSAPLDRVVSGATFTKANRVAVLVTIETDSGVTGRIYSGDERDEQERLREYLVERLAPVIVGEDPRSVARLWERMLERSIGVGDEELFMHALGAVDTALWDLVGKHAGQPLYRLWGGYRDSLPVVATGGYYADDDGFSLEREVRDYREMGLAGMKLKVGGRSVEEDVARLNTVMDAADDGFRIVCDANRGWTVEQAVEFAERTEEHDVYWFEEPVVWYDQYEGMRRVGERTSVPIAAGQNECVPEGCRVLVERSDVDVLNFDASYGGGPTAWRRVAAAAQQAGVRMAHHEEPHVAMHLLASVPNGLHVECFHPDIDPIWYDMHSNRPPVEDGRIELPDRPGLGIDIDEEFVDTHRVETASYE